MSCVAIFCLDHPIHTNFPRKMFFINLSSYVIHVYMSKNFKMKIKKQRGTILAFRPGCNLFELNVNTMTS